MPIFVILIKNVFATEVLQDYVLIRSSPMFNEFGIQILKKDHSIMSRSG